MRFTGGSVTEEKRRNGKSFNPKHWRICLSFTYDEEQEDGSTKKKRKRVTRIVEGTKTHAYEERDKLIAELDGKGETLDEVVQQQKEQEKVDNMTLTKLIELWDAARRTASKASERTLTEDRNRLRHVERHLGNVPVKDITIQMVEQTYAAIRKETGLSGTSMNQIYTLLKNVFEKGIDYDYIYRNPCTRVTAPRRNKPNRRALTAEEGTTLLAAVDESEAEAFKSLDEKEARRAYREKLGIAKERHFMRGLHDISCIMAVRIGLATGQRRGEVFALTWGDVDLDEGTIHVGHNVTYQDVVKTPKTDSGVRTIAIDPTTVEHLSMWKDRQAEELAKICVKQTDETPVCCSSTGGRIRIDNFSHWWGIWRKEHGFDGLKFHELRHTQATLLLANGVDVKTVQTRLGHASASITLDWYAHAIPQNDHAAAEMLGNLLNSKQEEDEPKDPQENAAQTQEESFRLLPHENLPKVTAKSRQKARRGYTKTGQLVQLVS